MFWVPLVFRTVDAPTETVGGEAVSVFMPKSGWIVIVYVWLPLKPLASVAITVNVNKPVVVGLPLSTPLSDSVRPGGNELIAANLYGPVPPLAETVWL